MRYSPERESAYLIAEFNKRWDDHAVSHEATEGETHVIVTEKGVERVMEIGSDDDDYVFSNGVDVVRIPEWDN